MRTVARLILLVMVGLGAWLLLTRTDNPLSRVLQRREAQRLGFVDLPRARNNAVRGDLEAYRAARRHCETQWEIRPLELKQGNCGRCVVRDCLEEEAKAYRSRQGPWFGALPAPGNPVR